MCSCRGAYRPGRTPQTRSRLVRRLPSRAMRRPQPAIPSAPMQSAQARLRSGRARSLPLRERTDTARHWLRHRQPCVARLAATVPGAKVQVLEGGIEAWRDAGLPRSMTGANPSRSCVRFRSPLAVLLWPVSALGVLVHPGFLGIAGFVGAGLTFAGLTGFCGMARLLALAPWNKAAAATSASLAT